MYKAKIDVTLKKSVLDPQGKTVLASLKTLGFDEPQDMRVGKFFEITLDVPTKEKADAAVHDMCDKLLVNPVIEEYHYTIEEV
jgi:phosphoribosylformylglycinamidine synthase subunit PurS